MTPDRKHCTKCKKLKIIHMDFYMCDGIYRSECKVCTIRRNVKYQSSIRAWKNRFVDSADQKSYMVEYYSRNKDKFAEYRKRFKEKHPDYYKDYAKKRKLEKT
jgi:hypothetical protein